MVILQLIYYEMINMHPLQKLKIEKWFLIISVIIILIITISMGILFLASGNIISIITGIVIIVGSIGVGLSIPKLLKHFEERKTAIINGIESGMIKIDEKDRNYKIE